MVVVVIPILSLLLSSTIAYATLTSSSARMLLTTTRFCNNDLMGMDDGYITTREDVIIANDGQVTVKALPNHPYQYFMDIQTPNHLRVKQLFMNEAFVLKDDYIDDDTVGVDTSSIGIVDGIGDKYNKVNKWVKKGVEGVDPSSGMNYTALYMTGIAPDTWTLYEADDTPLVMVVSNSFKNDRVFQLSTFTHFTKLQNGITVDEAESTMDSIYHVKQQQHRKLQPNDDSSSITPPPTVDVDMISSDYLPEASRAYFQTVDSNDIDWMTMPYHDNSNLRRQSSSSSSTFEGIDYFTIPKGSAADIYFHANTRTSSSLVAAVVDSTNKQPQFQWEYPTTCMGNINDKYCLHADANATTEYMSVDGGVIFRDPKIPSYQSHLDIGVVMSGQKDPIVIDLHAQADGCADVFQYGASDDDDVKIIINLCMSGNFEGDSLIKSDNRTFEADIDAKATFSFAIPHFTTITTPISSTIACTAGPNYDIGVLGNLGTGVDLKFTGGGIMLDLKGSTVDNLPKKWQFNSGVTVDGWVSVLAYKHKWSHRWVMWQTGPENM
ncbi:hypothetical protein FOL47_000647 [Perkinsus chesapeaki]|uniref:Uncharacterized protein n=1 Tax=Perkinsus chesapeaki TaxID=330153 RepID=A0A7J6ML61_PERCH|nr:hypothetical protein FOL47_000647 [Perkinsus chesapeaki]